MKLLQSYEFIMVIATYIVSAFSDPFLCTYDHAKSNWKAKFTYISNGTNTDNL